ncbi:hypothetical protein BDV40DRAFT_149357 [Aspergillus tamarii]|uniref:Uncharacterized protein n=1 Tax=Aspergillus tamarii TaxID=41984 RepID=A0A5N6UWR0_ASPTM|nr:hypothetical protein BDV40DRAFT_149357 [Aspergillus tamarii]
MEPFARMWPTSTNHLIMLGAKHPFGTRQNGAVETPTIAPHVCYQLLLLLLFFFFFSPVKSRSIDHHSQHDRLVKRGGADSWYRSGSSGTRTGSWSKQPSPCHRTCAG